MEEALERYKNGEITKQEMLGIINNDKEDFAHKAFYKGREVKYYQTDGYHMIPIFIISTFNSFLRGDEPEDHMTGDKSLDGRRRIPVRRVREIAYSIAYWATQREELRKTEKVIREAVEAGVEFPKKPKLSKHWVDDFATFFDACASTTLDGLDANIEEIEREKKNRKLN